jgi:hypothetical protein
MRSSTQLAWHSATATSCSGSQYEQDTYGECSRWASFSGVPRLVTQPCSRSPSWCQIGCTTRERGRPRRSTVASVHQTMR